jgi:MtN3 and saliva related transmembrane protein
MPTADWVGALATLCSTVSFVPQVWKIFRTGETDALSLRMYVVTVAGFALWLAYGWMLGAWPLIAANGACLTLASFILLMKLLPDARRRHLLRRVGGATEG